MRRAALRQAAELTQVKPARWVTQAAISRMEQPHDLRRHLKAPVPGALLDLVLHFSGTHEIQREVITKTLL
jgi:hypothetical protein